MKFYPGPVFVTRGLLEVIPDGQALIPYLARHLEGDFGEVNAEDAALNRAAIKFGGRVLSAYRLPNRTKFWIITDGVGPNGGAQDYTYTTCLLPDEY